MPMTLCHIPAALVVSRFLAAPVLLWADTLFYACVALAVWHLHRALLGPFLVPLLVVLGLMGVNWSVAMLRFRRPLKLPRLLQAVGLSLFAVSVSLLGFSYAGWFLWAAVAVGIAGHPEGFVMTLILPRWAHDVSGIPEALRLRAAARGTLP